MITYKTILCSMLLAFPCGIATSHPGQYVTVTQTGLEQCSDSVIGEIEFACPTGSHVHITSLALFQNPQCHNLDNLDTVAPALSDPENFTLFDLLGVSGRYYPEVCASEITVSHEILQECEGALTSCFVHPNAPDVCSEFNHISAEIECLPGSKQIVLCPETFTFQYPTTPFYLYTPSFEFGRYEALTTCRCTLETDTSVEMTLEVLFMEIESGNATACPYDFIEFDGSGRICGEQGPLDAQRITRGTSPVYVDFITDSTINKKGAWIKVDTPDVNSAPVAVECYNEPSSSTSFFPFTLSSLMTTNEVQQSITANNETTQPTGTKTTAITTNEHKLTKTTSTMTTQEPSVPTTTTIMTTREPRLPTNMTTHEPRPPRTSTTSHSQPIVSSGFTEPRPSTTQASVEGVLWYRTTEFSIGIGVGASVVIIIVAIAIIVCIRRKTRNSDAKPTFARSESNHAYDYIDEVIRPKRNKIEKRDRLHDPLPPVPTGRKDTFSSRSSAEPMYHDLASQVPSSAYSLYYQTAIMSNVDNGANQPAAESYRRHPTDMPEYLEPIPDIGEENQAYEKMEATDSHHYERLPHVRRVFN